jgi:hypothetical protein
MPIPCPPSAIAMSAINTELGFASNAANSSLSTRASQTGGYVPGAPDIQFSEFCGYSPTPNYRTFSIYDQGQTQGEVCNIIDQDNLTLYFYESGGDGSPACPNVSVTLYTDTALTSPFDGADRWYHSNQCTAGYYILGSPNRGFVESINPC